MGMGDWGWGMGDGGWGMGDGGDDVQRCKSAYGLCKSAKVK